MSDRSFEERPFEDEEQGDSRRSFGYPSIVDSSQPPRPTRVRSGVDTGLPSRDASDSMSVGSGGGSASRPRSMKPHNRMVSSGETSISGFSSGAPAPRSHSPYENPMSTTSPPPRQLSPPRRQQQRPDRSHTPPRGARGNDSPTKESQPLPRAPPPSRGYRAAPSINPYESLRASGVLLRAPSRRMVSLARDNDSVVSFIHSVHKRAPDPPPIANPSYLEDAFVTVYTPSVVVGSGSGDRRDSAGEESRPLVGGTGKKGDLETGASVDPTEDDDDEKHSFASVEIAQFYVQSTGNTSMKKKKKSSFSAFQLKTFIKKIFRHKLLKLFQLSLVIYILYQTLYGGLRNPDTGLVVDPESDERTAAGVIEVNGSLRPVVGATKFQVILVGFARSCAFFMYPALVLVFISKFRATTSFLMRTPLAMFMEGDLHELHLYCGWTILIFATAHTIFHFIRWGNQGNLYLLMEHRTGMTGLFIISSMFLITLPMIVYRAKVRYEIRKNMHYLFLVFAAALAFHVPSSAFPNGGFAPYVFTTILVWYFLDAGYCYFFMTEKIETTKFDVLPNGVQMTMRVSDFFQKNGAQGGYCYVCLPWVDRTQWHAFSLFENPVQPQERQIFMQQGGDWTRTVHEYLQRDTVRPAWVQGPYPSPYNYAESYDNEILVASGIGITPALSVIRAHKDSRRINLIWAVRDRHLLEFFLRHLYLDHSGWNLIFYTGKEELKPENVEVFTNTNVCIILGRPNLRQLIPNIIYGVESGNGLPELYVPEVRRDAADSLAEYLDDNVDGTIHDGAVEDVVKLAEDRGFRIDDREAIKKELNEKNGSSGAIYQHLDFSFKPWEEQPSAAAFVKDLSKDRIISTWGMMYCGGARILESELKKISDKYGIDLHIESFGW